MTTISNFSSDKFKDKNALPGPAWYAKLKIKYVPLTPFIPTADFLGAMIFKNIDEGTLASQGVPVKRHLKEAKYQRDCR